MPKPPMRETIQAIPWSGTTPELFEGLSDSDCLSILSTACHTDIVCGEWLFQVGDPKKKIFLLTEGRVKVTLLSKGGSEVILWLNVPGQIVGSLNLAERAHSSTAQAVQACKVLTWDLTTFETILDRFPRLFRNVTSMCVTRMNELSCRIREISTEPVIPRLAHALTRLTPQVGRIVNGHFELDLTQEALAQMTATSLFTVCRQLSQWERQGLVACRRSTVVILDLHGLERLGSNQEILPAQEAVCLGAGISKSQRKETLRSWEN